MAIEATGNTFKNQNTNFAYKYETTNNEESLCILQKHKHRGNQLLPTRQSNNLQNFCLLEANKFVQYQVTIKHEMVRLS